MVVRRVSWCALVFILMQGCFLDRSSLDGTEDASAPLDASAFLDAQATLDAGERRDSGTPVIDAGPIDAGPVDPTDAGPEDAGTGDAGAVDAGAPDAGPELEVPGPPGAPTFSEVGTSSMRVSWTPPTFGGPVVSYELQRATDADPTAFTTVGTPTAPTFVDGALGVDAGYWYRVRAVNGAGPGLYSAASPQKTASPEPVLRAQFAEAWTFTPTTALFGTTPVEGNLLVAIGVHRENDANASIPGWDQRIDQQFRTNDSNRRQLVVFTRVAGPSEPRNVTLSWDSGRTSRLLIQEFDLRGGAVSFAAQASSDSGNSSVNALSASVGTAADSLLVIGAFGSRHESGPVNFTGLGASLGNSSFISISSAFGEVAHPGGTLTQNVSWESSQRASMGFVAFRRDP